MAQELPIIELFVTHVEARFCLAFVPYLINKWTTQLDFRIDPIKEFPLFNFVILHDVRHYSNSGN